MQTPSPVREEGGELNTALQEAMAMRAGAMHIASFFYTGSADMSEFASNDIIIQDEARQAPGVRLVAGAVARGKA